MSKATKRLGRGLDSLVSNLSAPPERVAEPDIKRGRTPDGASHETGSSSVRAIMLTVGELSPNPFQPRNNPTDENILSLAESIRRSGMVQPIVARPRGGGYQIIAGERRWLAAKSLGLAEIPALIREATDDQMLELALIENIQREDLNAIDRAKAYRQFCSAFSLKTEEVANRVGEDRSTVANYVRLLDLPQSIQGQLAGGTLSMGHARCLLGVSDDERREQLARAVILNQLSVRALEEIVRRERTRQTPPGATPAERKAGRPAHLLDMQRRFEEAVKTKVTIQEGKKKGTGRLVIEYYSLDDFDRLASLLGVSLE